MFLTGNATICNAAFESVKTVQSCRFFLQSRSAELLECQKVWQQLRKLHDEAFVVQYNLQTESIRCVSKEVERVVEPVCENTCTWWILAIEPKVSCRITRGDNWGRSWTWTIQKSVFVLFVTWRGHGEFVGVIRQKRKTIFVCGQIQFLFAGKANLRRMASETVGST